MLSLKERWDFVDPDHGCLDVKRQCRLLGVARSGWYYQPVESDAEDVVLMNLIDEQYTETPDRQWFILFLRKSEDGCVFELPWSLCESEAGTKVNAGDGDSRDMPWARNLPTQNGSCGVSVSFEGGCDQEAESRGRQWFIL